MNSTNNITYNSTEHWIRLLAYHAKYSNQVNIIRILIIEILVRKHYTIYVQVRLSRGMAQP
jgi:hypothetical protein